MSNKIISVVIIFLCFFHSALSIANESIIVKNDNFDYTIGICTLVENPPIEREKIGTAMAPIGFTSAYLENNEKLKLDWSHWSVNIINMPAYGTIETDRLGSLRYIPSNHKYFGPDQAVLLVKIGHLKIKAIHDIKLMPVIGGTDGYDPYKEHCINGVVWKM